MQVSNTVLLLLLFFITSCIKIEVLDVPDTKQDTVIMYKPRTSEPQPPREDTTRIPIVFDATVEEWVDVNSSCEE